MTSPRPDVSDPAGSDSGAPDEGQPIGQPADAQERERTGGATADLNGAPAHAAGPAADPSGAAGGEPTVSVVASQPPRPSPASRSSLWTDRLPAVAASFYEWLSRPRVRLTVTGIILLLIGGVISTNSVWTLPLVVIGALMVVIAWVGCRLDGRFAVEWGQAGTQLEFRAMIKPALPAASPLKRTPSASPRRVRESEPEGAEIIDGEAHTVEIELAELEALIAAAETPKAEIAQPEALAQAARNLRFTNGGGRSTQAPH
jgi:hypothetical protein